MPKGTLASVGLASLLLACAGEPRPLPAAAEPGSPPLAVFPAVSHDFGTVPRGERLEHAFVIRNDGGSDLLIERVEAGPLLTVDGFDATVAAGSEGRVRLAFATAGRRGSGRLQATVYSNDPERPEQLLTLEGRVVGPVEIEPQDRVYFFDVLEGQPARQELTLVNYSERPFEVRSVRSDSAWFEARIEPLEPGRRFRLVVELSPLAPAGRHQATVTIATDSPAHPAIPILARATIEGAVRARPRSVDFSRVLAEDLVSAAVARREVRISRRGGTGFEVLSASADLPFLEVTLRAERPGETYLVTLTIDRGEVPKGEFEGTLTVRTNDPDFERLELPVRGTVL